MENGSIVVAPKRLRGRFIDQSFAYPLLTRHGRAWAKRGPSIHESSSSFSSLSRPIAHSSTTVAAPTAKPIFQAHWPEPLTEYDRSGLTSFNPVGLTSPNPVGDSGVHSTDRRAARSILADPRDRCRWARAPHRSHCLRWARASRPTTKALLWMGSCPALNMLSWVDCPSALLISTVFAHTSHA